MTIRVLVIDDSATMRALLTARLSAESDIEVVGAAADAAQGREAIKRLNPDVVTLDIEMPGMNGLDFLEKIMQLRPTPVIIVSGSTSEGAANTARALALGAVDCYAKSEHGGGLAHDDGGKLANLVREASVRAGREVAIMADLQGPKIRVGKFAEGKIQLEKGATFVLDADCDMGNIDVVGINTRTSLCVRDICSTRERKYTCLYRYHVNDASLTSNVHTLLLTRLVNNENRRNAHGFHRTL